MKKYLVTGGSGFIGSAVVRAMQKAGHHVRVFDNNSRGSLQNLKDIQSEIEWVQGDVRDLDSVTKALKGMDGVCHLAAVNGTANFYSKPTLVLEVAVKGMLNALDGCIKHGVRDFILMSSSEVYQLPPTIPTPEDVPLVVPDVQNPRFSYGAGKLISEVLALNYSNHFDRISVVRPHNVYGPAMGFEHVVPEFIVRMAQLAQDTKGKIQFPIQGSGRETRAFVYIDDMVSGFMTVLNRGLTRNVYHVGTNVELSVANIAKQIAKYFGREVDLIPSQLTQGSTPRRCPDISKVQALGYTPTVSLEKGIALTAEWYVRNLSENKVSFRKAV